MKDQLPTDVRVTEALFERLRVFWESTQAETESGGFHLNDYWRQGNRMARQMGFSHFDELLQTLLSRSDWAARAERIRIEAGLGA